jgi:hypothetical protein
MVACKWLSTLLGVLFRLYFNENPVAGNIAFHGAVGYRPIDL